MERRGSKNAKNVDIFIQQHEKLSRSEKTRTSKKSTRGYCSFYLGVKWGIVGVLEFPIGKALFESIYVRQFPRYP
jgi:hypothetical protein